MKTIITILILFFTSLTIWGQVAVIAHKDSPIDDINPTRLLDFYSGDIRYWDNEEPVIVFDFKPRGELKDNFYKYIGKSTSRMKSIWMKNMLSGEGNPPEALESEETMLEKVSLTPGSIGFVSEAKANKDVKVLAVIPLD